tara:strand:+ start:201 stop:392 length:192 start_codon:yes stop_codon:yes gene_type:complete
VRRKTLEVRREKLRVWECKISNVKCKSQKGGGVRSETLEVRGANIPLGPPSKGEVRAISDPSL